MVATVASLTKVNDTLLPGAAVGARLDVLRRVVVRGTRN